MLLKETYKTYENASKRARFENGVALSEFRNGLKAKHYQYRVVNKDGAWRVERSPKGE